MVKGLRKLKTYLLGKRPAPGTLKVRKAGGKDRGTCVQEKVYLRYPGEEDVPAYVLIPKNADLPAPAVLCPHPHGLRYDLGKEGTVQRHGDAYWPYALDLAERGFVTMTPDSKCFGERQHRELDAEQLGFGERFEATKEILYGRCIAQRHLRDLCTATDYLVARKEVDARRLGCIGFSMGSAHVSVLAALDGRIRCVVACCGITTLSAIIEDELIHNYFHYIPGLLESLDMPEILSEIVPRPFLVLNGRDDASVPLKGLRQVERVLRPLYRAKGAAGRFKVYVGPHGHEFCDDFQNRAYDWLGRWLTADGRSVADERREHR